MRPLLAAAGLMAFSLAALSQTDRGTITGTITDPAGRGHRQRDDPGQE
jgi:hypothetical protein